MPDQKLATLDNQDTQPMEVMSPESSQGGTNKEHQEKPLFDKIEKALGIDSSTFDVNLLPPERD